MKVYYVHMWWFYGQDRTLNYKKMLIFEAKSSDEAIQKASRYGITSDREIQRIEVETLYIDYTDRWPNQ